MCLIWVAQQPHCYYFLKLPIALDELLLRSMILKAIAIHLIYSICIFPIRYFIYSILSMNTITLLPYGCVISKIFSLKLLFFKKLVIYFFALLIVCIWYSCIYYRTLKHCNHNILSKLNTNAVTFINNDFNL